MPDSLPPPAPWGIPPYDERDLDALLSGEATETPVMLRSLADALTALKGPPTPAELHGEATIMAEFRALAEFGAFGPASAPGPAPATEPALDGIGARPGGRAETLELPALRPDSRRRRTARHRVRRPARRRSGAFFAVAAAAAIVGAIALAGNLPGPFQNLAHHLAADTHVSSSSARPTSPNLQDRSASSVPTVSPRMTVRPSPSPSPSVAGSPNGSELCRTFFSHFTRPVTGQQWWKWPAYSQLSTEADGSGHIIGFCRPYLKDVFPHGVPTQFPGFFGTGQYGQGGSGSAAHQPA
jgi:hypothetical protein